MLMDRLNLQGMSVMGQRAAWMRAWFVAAIVLLLLELAGHPAFAGQTWLDCGRIYVWDQSTGIMDFYATKPNGDLYLQDIRPWGNFAGAVTAIQQDGNKIILTETFDSRSVPNWSGFPFTYQNVTAIDRSNLSWATTANVGTPQASYSGGTCKIIAPLPLGAPRRKF
jgi:hypothetical protein